MKLLLKLLLIIGSVIIIIAPFTFLKPSQKPVTVERDEKVPKPIKVIKKPEKPLHNIALPQFSKIKDIRQKKRAFFEFLKPAIIQANNKLLTTRAAIQAMKEQLTAGENISKTDSQLLLSLQKKYRIKGHLQPKQQVEALLRRIDIVPVELVLVQAANESAWGTSRFAKIGLNFFGLWCYKKGCGMVPNSRDAGLKHEVAAFETIDFAVERYLYNINSNNAYRVFRAIRQQLRSYSEPLHPEILATGLLPYSERGVDYVVDIIDMLKHNASYISVSED
ncbi:MAG: glucosaminidase domain-containing protein [Thalassotalea sp.]